MPEVSVRDLRQNLSVFLERVEAGETLSVTRRGQAVAVLAPLPGRGTPTDWLVAHRGATAPTVALEELGPPLASRLDESPSEHLERQRSERLRPD